MRPRIRSMRRGRGAEHRDLAARAPAAPPSASASAVAPRAGLGALDAHREEPAERRVAEPPPLRRARPPRTRRSRAPTAQATAGVAGLKVCTMTRPGVGAAPGAPGDLREELERALGGAEVGEGERGVGEHHADERDAREVVPLRHHLRADEHVDLAPREAREQRRGRRPRCATASRSSRATRARGKSVAHRLLDLLGADADADARRRRTPGSARSIRSVRPQ